MSSPTNPISPGSPPYVGQPSEGQPVQPGQANPPLPLDKLEDGSAGAAAKKWTPPSCPERFCTYVKNRIADFIDWVCSLFCSSKAATKEQMEVVEKRWAAVDGVDNSIELVEERFKKFKASSTNEVYRYLANYIEGVELIAKVNVIKERWKQHKDNLQNNRNLKSGVVLTERQMRADERQMLEISACMKIFAHSDLPEETTLAMRSKVEAFSLGKLTSTKNGKVVSLFDTEDPEELPKEFTDQAVKLIKEIRAPALQKLDQLVAPLKNKATTCYASVTLKDLEKESRAVHVLAHCIAMMEFYGPLHEEQGDISEKSLTRRIAKLEKCLARDVFGEATPEMRKIVEAFDFRGDKIINTIVEQTYPPLSNPPGDYTKSFYIRDRLQKVVAEVQRPKGATAKKAEG